MTRRRYRILRSIPQWSDLTVHYDRYEVLLWCRPVVIRVVIRMERVSRPLPVARPLP